MVEAPDCPLCAHPGARRFALAHGRRYLDCGRCRLVFVAPEDRPSPEAERAHYATHENDPHDPRYRAWLERLAAPLAARLPAGARGLDYGCGPGPALPLLLAERGHPTELYDPFFAPDPAPLGRTHDFVACTEAAEHFHRPGEELRRLDGLLRPGGWLAVMTSLLRDDTPLEEWRYARDPTHVSLYRAETLEWIAARFGWSLERPARDVSLFRKPGEAVGP